MMIFKTVFKKENEKLEVLQFVGKRRRNAPDRDSSLTTDLQTKYVHFFFFNCLSSSLMWRDRQTASQTLWHLAKLQ